MADERNVVQLDAAQAALREDFLKWQCRLRQMAVRHADGRPQSGMRPYVRLPDEDEPRARITVLVIEREPEATTSEFKHMVRRTVDPVDRHGSALKKLGGTYYQDPEKFSDELTGLFGPNVPLAEELLRRGECRLDFEQGGQRYSVPCSVERLPSEHPAFEATYWHNCLFNPEMPPGVAVLRFKPAWSRAWADPMPR